MGRHTVRAPGRPAWPQRSVLGAAAAAAAGLTATWAGLDPLPALLVAVGAGTVALGAAWLSATLPHHHSPDTPPTGRATGRETDSAPAGDAPTRTPRGDGAAGGDPVQ